MPVGSSTGGLRLSTKRTSMCVLYHAPLQYYPQRPVALLGCFAHHSTFHSFPVWAPESSFSCLQNTHRVCLASSPHVFHSMVPQTLVRGAFMHHTLPDYFPETCFQLCVGGWACDGAVLSRCDMQVQATCFWVHALCWVGERAVCHRSPWAFVVITFVMLYECCTLRCTLVGCCLRLAKLAFLRGISKPCCLGELELCACMIGRSECRAPSELPMGHITTCVCSFVRRSHKLWVHACVSDTHMCLSVLTAAVSICCSCLVSSTIVPMRGFPHITLSPYPYPSGGPLTNQAHLHCAPSTFVTYARARGMSVCVSGSAHTPTSCFVVFPHRAPSQQPQRPSLLVTSCRGHGLLAVWVLMGCALDQHGWKVLWRVVSWGVNVTPEVMWVNKLSTYKLYSCRCVGVWRRWYYLWERDIQVLLPVAYSRGGTLLPGACTCVCQIG
jgi:hypothetical protein